MLIVSIVFIWTLISFIPFLLAYIKIILDMLLLSNPIYVSGSMFNLVPFIVRYIWLIASCKYSILNADPFACCSHVNTILYSAGVFSSTFDIFSSYGN